MTPLNSTAAANPASTTPPSAPAALISVNLQQRLARVSEQFGGVVKEELKEDHIKEELDNEHGPQQKLRRLSVRLDRCEVPSLSEDSGPDPNAAFQPYIATPEEAAAAAAAVGQARAASPTHVLDAAVTAAVNEAISGIQEAMM